MARAPRKNSSYPLSRVVYGPYPIISQEEYVSEGGLNIKLTIFKITKEQMRPEQRLAEEELFKYIREQIYGDSKEKATDD